MTLNMVIIQTTAWFGTIDNAKYSQIYIQDQIMMTTRQNELQNREGVSLYRFVLSEVWKPDIEYNICLIHIVRFIEFISCM